MEPFFQKLFTEFDLDLFDQATTANQAAPPTPCPVTKKHSLARMKNLIQNTNLVVRKAKGTHALLEETQKDLQETRTELEETKKILYDKNEDHKAICNERNTYFNQTLEYSNEFQTLKQKLQSYEESDYEAKLKDRVIQGYSDQVQGLLSEVKNIETAKKKSEKESALAVARANKDKYWAEKKLVKVLTYIFPLLKKPDRWLKTLLNKYLPHRKLENGDLDESEHSNDETFDIAPMSPFILEPKEDESGKMQKPPSVNLDPNFKVHEVIIEDVESPINSSMLNRNNSLDFEFVGSVDTGRGSSLAFSDGEKSFHSPDYYMNDSPLSTVPNLCNRCNVPKSDIATSPIHETSNIVKSSATNTYSPFIPKRDVCTSPLSLERLDVATDTTDISNDRSTRRSRPSCRKSPKKLEITKMGCHNQTISTTLNVGGIEEPVNAVDNKETASNDIRISNEKSLTISLNLPDNTTSDTNEIVHKNNRTPVENVTAIQPGPYEKAETINVSIYNKELPTIHVKPPHDIISTTEIRNKVNSIARPDEDIIKVQADNNDKTATNNNNISVKESPAIPVTLPDNKTSANINNIDRIASTVKGLTSTQPDKNKIPATNNIKISNKESHTTPVNLPDNKTSNFDEFLNNDNRIAGRDENNATIPAIDYDEAAKNASSQKLSMPVASHRNKMPNTILDLNRSTLHEKECLDLNNSNNLSNDITTDSEIQTILDKMQVRPQLITPIPPTPPRRRLRSPKLISNDISQKSQQKSKKMNLDKSLNRFKKGFKQLLNHFDFSLEIFERMPGIYSNDETNQALIRNLITYSNYSNNCHASHDNKSESFSYHDTNFELSTQAGVVNTASALQTNMSNNNTDHTNEGSAEASEDDDSVLQIQDCKSDNFVRKNIELSTQTRVANTASALQKNITNNNKAHTNEGSASDDDSVLQIQDCKSDNLVHTNIELSTQASVVNTASALQKNITNNNKAHTNEGSASDDDSVLQIQDCKSDNLVHTNIELSTQASVVNTVSALLSNITNNNTAHTNEDSASDDDSVLQIQDCKSDYLFHTNLELSTQASVVNTASALQTNITNNNTAHTNEDSASDDDSVLQIQDCKSDYLVHTNIELSTQASVVNTASALQTNITNNNTTHTNEDSASDDDSVLQIQDCKSDYLDHTNIELSTQASVVNTASALQTNITNNNTTHTNEGSASDYESVLQIQDCKSDHFDHMPSTKSNNSGKYGMCKINIEKTIIIVPMNEVPESESAASLNDKHLNKRSDSIQNGHIPQKYTQEIFSNNNVYDSINNTEGSVLNLNTYGTQSATEFKNNLVFDDEDSDDDIPQQSMKSEDLNHSISKETRNCKQLTSNIEPTTQITKKSKRKLTMLEKRRLQLMPKSKIREAVQKSARKMRFKPTPIITVPKKKITESDTAATLNDKSVYENAVKVMATFKSNKSFNQEPRVFVEDYLTEMRNDLQNNLNNDKNDNNTENNLKSHLPTETLTDLKTKKRNLLVEFEKGASENCQNTREQPKRIFADKSEPVASKRKRTPDSKESTPYNEIKRTKRKRANTCDRQSSDKHVKDTNVGKSESVTCRRLLRSSKSFDESESETLNTINNNDLLRDLNSNESLPYNATNETKRIRSSVSDCQSPHKKTSNSNKQIDNHGRTCIKEGGECETPKTKKRSTSTCQSADGKIDRLIVTEEVANRTVAKKRRAANRKYSDDKPSDNTIEEKRNQIIHEISDGPVSPSQRILRSSTVQHNKGFKAAPICAVTNSECNRSEEIMDQDLKSQQDDNIACVSSQKKNSRIANISMRKSSESSNIDLCNSSVSESVYQNNHESTVSYADLGLFMNEETCEQNKRTQKQSNKTEVPANINRNNVLCRMIEKYGIQRIKVAKKVPDNKVNEMFNKLDTSISHIVELPHEQCLGAMKKLVADILSWNTKHFLAGLLKFLKDPQRKIELFKKVQSQQQVPYMTKKEQVLLYVIDELQNSFNYKGIVKKILMNIEYVLFALNKTPDFDVVESMSHFYALLCRYHQKMSQLRLFIVDAMYCLQYKSIILIKQCLEVWMFILPLGHMGLAKTSLVTCLVYLLHFYKCDDKKQTVFELRNILRRKYNFELKDWNETKILDVFRTAITEVKDNPLEKKMLRLALIILAKRYGPKWCHNHIVKRMLQPMIASETTPSVAKQFAVSVLGALLKPYPNDMKVHCEMVTDYLLEMLDQKQSLKMQEAIMTSLMCVNRYHERVIQFLLKWNPKQLSPEFYGVLKDYVRSKTVKTWKCKLSQIL